MTWKESLTHEVKLLLFYTSFLTFFFFVFTVFRLLTDVNAQEATYRFGYNIVEALVLSKLILLGQHFHLAEKYNDKPLIVPTLYKTFIFSLFVLAMSIVEEYFIGMIRGKTLSFVTRELFQSGYKPLFGKILLMSFVLFFFFSILETARVLGGSRLYDLFFRRR